MSSAELHNQRAQSTASLSSSVEIEGGCYEAYSRTQRQSQEHHDAAAIREWHGIGSCVGHG